MRQLVYTMFISNNCLSLQLWWKGNLVKHRKVSKYCETDCGFGVSPSGFESRIAGLGSHFSGIPQKSVTWKYCSMKKAQDEVSATWKNTNCHSKIRKKCTTIVHYSAQTYNRPSVGGRLYTVFFTGTTPCVLLQVLKFLKL